MRFNRSGFGAVLAAIGLLLSACSGGGGGRPAAAASTASLTADDATSTTAASSTTTTEAPTTTTAAPKATTPPPAGLGSGSTGPAVLALQQRLVALHYWVGTPDGVFAQDTVYAVTAFQKVTGMARTGRATDDVLKAMETATTPAPLVAGGEAHRIEVDIPRQVLFLYEGGAITEILPVSTGSMERFCSEGYCRIAGTPTGAFKVYRQDTGWNDGPLGALYNANFIVGGIAIHGAQSVPATPASHGCIRIPMSAAEWFPTKARIGTPVYVTGGPNTVSANDIVGPAPATTVAPGVNPQTTVTTAPGLLGGLLGGK
ncbi:MAG: L,D-transpeptidase family protein [Actinomycetota bacterium]|nr:L,D-transpeptidase family protein [Actinomycetota bacterium]